MRFVIQRMVLTDAGGEPIWEQGPGPEYCCQADGASARSVLMRFIRERANVEVEARATFRDEQAVIVARNGATLCAYRAISVSGFARDSSHRSPQ